MNKSLGRGLLVNVRGHVFFISDKGTKTSPVVKITPLRWPNQFAIEDEYIDCNIVTRSGSHYSVQILDADLCDVAALCPQ